MKPLLTIAGIFISVTVNAQQNTDSATAPFDSTALLTIVDSSVVQANNKTKINFFVISKPKKILDPATYFNIVRAKIKGLFRPKKFVCIVASSADNMASKIEAKLKKRNAEIGSLWFDSHGHYAKGYSLFEIGNDEFSYKNIFDSNSVRPFYKLLPYCTSNTKIGIGSCYGGATYTRPGSTHYAESKMNGDSLMIGLGNVFTEANIYACESWVMTKPGLFKERFAMAGHPLRKKFKDVIFDPVWDRLGVWNNYHAASGQFRAVNCVMLTKYGDIRTRFNNFQSLKRVKKSIAANKKKLQPNLLKPVVELPVKEPKTMKS